MSDVSNGKDNTTGVARSSITEELDELRALVQSLVSDRRSTASSSNSCNIKLNIIPEFCPESGNISADRWVSLIDEIASLNYWDERTTIVSMQSKLSGLARKWFSGLTTINLPWATWKEKLIKAFPEGFDYDTMLKAMINRAKKPQETMTEYYYKKTLMLSRLGISGKNAVSCVIGGLNSMSQREGAGAGHYKDPETLFAEYLANLEESRVSEKISNYNELKNGPRSDRKNFRSKTEKPYVQVCYNCKDKGHLAKDCKKPRKQCTRCKRLGHLESDCRVKITSNETATIANPVLTQSQNQYFVKIQLSGEDFVGFVDSGSSVNTICESLVKKLDFPTIECNILMSGYAGGSFQANFKVETTIKVDAVEGKTELLVVPDRLQSVAIIIGRPFLNGSDAVVIATKDYARVMPRSIIELSEIEDYETIR